MAARERFFVSLDMNIRGQGVPESLNPYVVTAGSGDLFTALASAIGDATFELESLLSREVAVDVSTVELVAFDSLAASHGGLKRAFVRDASPYRCVLLALCSLLSDMDGDWYGDAGL